MTLLTPHSDRDLLEQRSGDEIPVTTVSQELEREAATIGSALQLAIRLRWWVAAMTAVSVFAWKGEISAQPADRLVALEQHVVDTDRNVGSLVKLACLQFGPRSIEITMSDITCPASTPAAPPEHTAGPRR